MPYGVRLHGAGKRFVGCGGNRIGAGERIDAMVRFAFGTPNGDRIRVRTPRTGRWREMAADATRYEGEEKPWSADGALGAVIGLMRGATTERHD